VTSVTLLQNEPGGATEFPGGGEAPKTYRIFDACIRSQISLPELPLWGEAEPRLRVETVRSGQINQRGFITCHEWKSEDGRVLCRCARRDAEYLLSFPGRASFHLVPGGVIRCLPGAGVTGELLRQLLLSQVIPRFLAHAGALLLHASAVTLPNGKTVAFLGQSGHGKSTLVSYCHQRGAQIIDDDCILVRPEDRCVTITGGAPTVRLYPDSLRALEHDPAAFVPYLESSEKRQMRIPPGSTPGVPRVLDALFLLAAPGPARDTVHFEPATGQEAVIAILTSVFTLDPTHIDTMTRTFRLAGRTLKEGSGLPVRVLHYPREYDRLEWVFEALSDHLCR